MRLYDYSQVELTGGFWKSKEELNRTTTIQAVYDRFFETGRVGAFQFDWKEDMPNKPHVFWDSDIAKWMEGAAYILKKHPDPDLEKKVDDLVDLIAKHQDANGYFNIYYTVCEPENRFTNRDKHELYCAGHLMEAAVAYAEATGKTLFYDCMEKYADHIRKVFVEEKSAGFRTPGHQEIELALVRMYRYSGKKKFLDLAAYFINTRGAVEEDRKGEYNQSHKPVREQTEAIGHAVRALYMYTGMAYVAKETCDEALQKACRILYEDVTRRKMYVTGGFGSTYLGEAFTTPYDLPNDLAYAETCAGIAMMFFGNAMLALNNDADYADTMETVFYNGLLSGLSLDGTAFFYENPLEINLAERFQVNYQTRRLPITQRKVCFSCSCCPPNINRFLASLGNYIYGQEGDTLYVNQFASSTLNADGVQAEITTDYPRTGKVVISAQGVKMLAVRIPAWCKAFTISKPYTLEKGYALIENDGPVTLEFDLTPTPVYATAQVKWNAGKVCIRRGPIVYCAEAVDNAGPLSAYQIAPDFAWELKEDFGGLPTLAVSCRKVKPFETLYADHPAETEAAQLTMIPYQTFANRGESEMQVWFTAQ